MKLDAAMKALKQGDTSRFQEIYEATKKPVYFMALSVLKNRVNAEDAMQNTYLQVLRKAGQYRGGTSAVAWIVKIARNTSLNMLKNQARSFSVDAEENAVLFGVESSDESPFLLDLARQILEEDEFQIFVMAAVHGYKRREIAEIMEMPLPTVTWKYNKATEKLRVELKDGAVKGGLKNEQK